MSEYGWVIEGAWSHVQTPDYWVGSSAWSPDHNRALRFVRKQDAEQAASMMLDGLRVRICEHAWACAPEYQQGRAQSAREPQYQDRPTAADSAVGKTNDELEAIRARDRDYDDVFEAQASMSKDIAHRLVAWPVADRRALLAYVDALAAERDALRKDAERYRWLVGQNDPIIWHYLGGMDDDQIDEAIDKWIADDAHLSRKEGP